MEQSKPKQISWFTLILLITIWLNFFVFTTIKIPSEELNKIHILEDNETYLEIPKSVFLSREEGLEELFEGNFQGLMWRSIYIKSKADKVCFQNKGSYLEYGGKAYYELIRTEVSYNKGEYFEVKKKECRSISKDDDKFTFKWGFQMELILDEIIQKSEVEKEIIPLDEERYLTPLGKATFHPNVGTYIQFGGIITNTLKFILLFFSTGALIWAFTRTIVLIKYGLKK